MPAGSLCETGHYVDHELVSNIGADCARREARLTSGGAVRYLLTIGGAGAQAELYLHIISELLPEVKRRKGRAAAERGRPSWTPGNTSGSAGPDAAADGGALRRHGRRDGLCRRRWTAISPGMHVFCDSDIFAAVYTTNVLMRACDVLVTKPGELSFYPVPKLMIRHVGGHEVWGAIRAAELGDGTFECARPEELDGMLRLIQSDPSVVSGMCEHIKSAGRAGIYDGAYRVVRLACTGRAD
jgi:hypothetical protein